MTTKAALEKEEELVSHFVHNALTLLVSIFLAYLVFQSGILDLVLMRTHEAELISALIAGFFFTSLISTAPAIIALGTIAIGGGEPLWLIALAGGAGALVGDLILFMFLKAHIADELYKLTLHPRGQRLKKLIHLRSVRWLLGFIGAVIIASPLPDELGLALMGVSRVRLWLLAILSFVFNAIGIYIIGLVAIRLF
jgi:hypothetical protein